MSTQDWTKEPPTTPGDYLMKDEGGGPTLYQCEIIEDELRCGPKEKRHRWPLDALWSESTRWKAAV